MSTYTAKIVSVARSYIASQLRMYAVAKDNLGKTTTKSNTFGYDVMVAAGIRPPPQVIIPGWIWDTIRPPTAAEWASATVAIPYWHIVAEPQPGDVVAEAHHYSDATGHCGIVVGDKETVCYSSLLSGVIDLTDWGFRTDSKPTFRRYGVSDPGDWKVPARGSRYA